MSDWNLTRDRLPQSLTDALAISGVVRDIEPGVLIYQQGDPSSSFSIVRSGRISMSRTNTDGHSSVAAVLAPGEAFGLYPLLMKRPRSHDCEAIERCELIQVSESKVWELIDTSPEARREVIYFLGERVARTFDALEDERRLPLVKRLGKRLLDYADEEGALLLSQSQLAHQMGVSRNAIGTALKNMSDLGMVSVEYGRTVVADRDALSTWVSGNETW